MITLTDHLKQALIASGDLSHATARQQVAAAITEGFRAQYGDKGVEYLVAAIALMDAALVIDRKWGRRP